MGFWQDFWQGTKRFFSRQCPRCGANDAELPAGKKIIRKIIKQHPHIRYYSRKGPDGQIYPESEMTWFKDVSYLCQVCNHTWEKKEISNSPG